MSDRKKSISVAVVKAGEKIAEKKATRVRPPRAKKPVLVPPVEEAVALEASILATDSKGRQYLFDPNAKAPYTGHSIVYPTSRDLDEDIPLQTGREDLRGINGASPFLLIHAATQALSRSKTRLPYKTVAVEYLRAALAILQADENFSAALNHTDTVVTPKVAEDRFVIANSHLQHVQDKAALTLEKALEELLFQISEEAAKFINVETQTLDEFPSVVNVIKPPTP